MLAIMRALEQWRHYLEGAKHPVQILMDHKNLEYFMTTQNLIVNKPAGRYICPISTSISRIVWVNQAPNPISSRDVRINKEG